MGKVIWIVNEYCVLQNDSPSRQSALSKYLQKKGYDAYVIAGSYRYKDKDQCIVDRKPYVYKEIDGIKSFVIKTHAFHGNAARALVAKEFQRKLWRLRKHLPKPYAIVSDFAGWFGNVVLKWKKKYGTRIIFDIQDLWPEGFVDMGYVKKNSLLAELLYSMEHKSYRKADGIIFSFQGGRDYLIDKGWSKEVGGDVDTSNIGYLNNGVDLDVVDRQKSEFVLTDSDLDTDKFKVIYLGSISAFNGLDILVETAKILQDRKIEDVLILVYGYGTQESKLKEMAKNYGLKNLKFKGKLDKRYAMNLLSRGDLNLFTFINVPLLRYGVSPNKLFMYFASGKPVLSMIRPNYDLVMEENCGLSVNNDSVEIADCILKFRDMEQSQYKGYCDRARAVAQRYDYKLLVNELLRFIEGNAYERFSDCDGLCK